MTIAYEQELNEEQLAVVQAQDGPALVIAGAGSGKTRTLTYRVAYLLDAQKIQPRNIALVTFTNKAAREMLNRARAITGLELRGIWGGTFHHVANIALRRFSKITGMDPNFTIIDREDCKTVLKQILTDTFPREAKVKQVNPDIIIEVASLSANTRVPLLKTIEEDYGYLMPFYDMMKKVLEEFEARKKQQNVMDFDDLLLNWHEALKNSEVLEAHRSMIRYVLVDEYQDTSRLQSLIAETIAGENGNIMVVGDDAQSIYSFRGASFDNIIDFPKRFKETRVYRLQINYRSAPEILELANSCIQNNKRQFHKTLRAVKPRIRKPTVVRCTDLPDEAKAIASLVQEYHDDRGIPYHEIAVLYRAHWHSLQLQVEMQSRGIPFEVRSGLRFFEQAHIKDVTAYMRIVHNPHDEIAWRRVLGFFEGVGGKTVFKVWNIIKGRADRVEALASEELRKSVSKTAQGSLEKLYKSLSILKNISGASEFIRVVMETEYRDYATLQYANSRQRIEEIEQLAEFARRYENLEAFLSQVVLVSNLAGADSADGNGEPDLAVLSTVHQAKGLEWDLVIIIGASKDRFPDARSMHTEAGLEEERRLFYVAATRARKYLYISYPMIVEERGMEIFKKPSEFIMELSKACYMEAESDNVTDSE